MNNKENTGPLRNKNGSLRGKRKRDQHDGKDIARKDLRPLKEVADSSNYDQSGLKINSGKKASMKYSNKTAGSKIIPQGVLQVPQKSKHGGRKNTRKEQKEMTVYIEKVKEGMTETEFGQNDFKHVAGAIEISQYVTPFVLLALTNDIELKVGNFYLLKNYSCFTNEDIKYILLGPETHVRLQSATKFEDVISKEQKRNLQIAEQLVDHVRGQINIQKFSHNVRTAIQLRKGESIHYLKAFVENVGLQSTKAKHRGTLIRLIDDKSGIYLTVLVPEEMVFQKFKDLPQAKHAVILRNFVTHRSKSFSTSMLIATPNSSIEILKDNPFEDLLTFQRKRPKLYEVVVISAGFGSPYKACPNWKCYGKKVDYCGEGQYQCTSNKCNEKFTVDQIQMGKRLILTIENDEHPEKEVTVFNKEIDDLMIKLGCDKLEDIPHEIVDKRIKTKIVYGNFGLGDVLKGISLIK